MVFGSRIFLFALPPLTLALHTFAGHRLRNLTLLCQPVILPFPATMIVLLDTKRLVS